MQLEALSAWLRFLTSADGFAEFGEWSVFIHSFSDDAASLVFEKYDYTGTNSARPQTTKYIVAPPEEENSLFCILEFLKENNYSLKQINSALLGMAVVNDADFDYGILGNFRILVMNLGFQRASLPLASPCHRPPCLGFGTAAHRPPNELQGQPVLPSLAKN